MHAGIHTPSQEQTLQEQTLPGSRPPLRADPSEADTPQEQTPPPNPPPPPGADTPLGAVHAGRYGQQAGGTHPTGVYTSLNLLIFLFSVETRLNVSRGASDNRHAVYPGVGKIAGDRPQRVCQGLLLQVISIHAKVWFTRNVFLHRFSHRLKVG